MSLTVRLDEDDEHRLEQIAALTKSDKSSVVRQLIQEKWSALGGDATFVERRGGHPANTLQGHANLSDRGKRKAEMASQFVSKALRRKRKEP